MSISAVMLHGENNPTLVRDTLFAIVMIILGGMVGVSLLLGGWRHREQHYNLQGANAYLGVIIPLAVLTLSLPNFTVTTPGPTLSFAQQIFLVVDVGRALLRLPRHPDRPASRLFHASTKTTTSTAPAQRPAASLALARRAADRLYAAGGVPGRSSSRSPIDYLIETLHAPAALGGVIIAMLVATPEAIGATRAALANKRAALDQYLPRLGAVHDRADRAGDAGDQPFHRARGLSRTG